MSSAALDQAAQADQDAALPTSQQQFEVQSNATVVSPSSVNAEPVEAPDEVPDEAHDGAPDDADVSADEAAPAPVPESRPTGQHGNGPHVEMLPAIALGPRQPAQQVDEVLEQQDRTDRSDPAADPEDPLARVIAEIQRQERNPQQPGQEGQDQQRRQRCLTQNKSRILMFVLPFLIGGLIYALWSTAILLTCDWTVNSKGVISAGIATQSQVMFMALREVFITVYDWISGKILDYHMRYVRYAALCCFDGCIILGFTIWATVMIAMEDCTECTNSEFYALTLSNVVVGYIYFCLTCCAPGPCLQVYNGGNVQQYITNALVEDFGQPVEENAVEIRERVVDQGRTGGVEGLKTGEFVKMASENVQKQSDFQCVICTEGFKESEKCIVLACNEKHIFHVPCIESWFKRATSCPVCRAEAA